MNEPAPAPIPTNIRGGTVLGGKYRLDYEIGRGAMGMVWAATHLSLDQRVAIKLVSTEYAQSPEARYRFSVEAKASAKLRSRYVVQVYDDGETPEGMPYIVMEYLHGETVEDKIAREGPLQLVEATRIATHVGRALSRAHARGIVHRDLKPANIFITQSEDDEFGWVAKVVDFGIAKVDDSRERGATKAGTVLGTPLFMSPEQVRGASEVDHRADLYSLGMVVYHMLTGRYGFDGQSFGDVLISICTDPLPDIRVAAPWLPPSVGDWFQRACAKDANQRFSSADEMTEALLIATNMSTNRISMADESMSPSGANFGSSSQPGSQQSQPGSQASADASGPFAVAATQIGSQPGTSSNGAATFTLHDATIPMKSSRRGVLIGLSVALVLLVGASVMVLSGRGASVPGSGTLAGKPAVDRANGEVSGAAAPGQGAEVKPVDLPADPSTTEPASAIAPSTANPSGNLSTGASAEPPTSSVAGTKNPVRPTTAKHGGNVGAKKGNPSKGPTEDTGPKPADKPKDNTDSGF